MNNSEINGEWCMRATRSFRSGGNSCQSIQRKEVALAFARPGVIGAEDTCEELDCALQLIASSLELFLLLEHERKPPPA